MKIIEKKIGNYGVLTGYIHETHKELKNIKSFPAILVIPGGGFRFCSFRETEPVAFAYYAEGYQAFTLKYTVVTDDANAVMADPMKDTELALKYIKSNQKNFCITEKNLAMLGFSGGGHLAAAVATHGPERPDALLLGYPGIIHSDLRALECPDIIECVDENTPESFLFALHGDPVTPPIHCLSFASALSQVGVPFELHIFKGSGHGLSLGTSQTCGGHASSINPDYAQWFSMSISWLQKIFGDFSVGKEK